MSAGPEHLGGVDPEIIQALEIAADNEEVIVPDSIDELDEDDESVETPDDTAVMIAEPEVENLAVDLSYDPSASGPFTRYLRSFGHIPSLNHEGRLELNAKRVAGLNAESDLEAAAQADTPLPPESVRELERSRDEGRQARQLMIDANQPLVVSVAKHYFSRGRSAGLEAFDLIQEGLLGLITAVDQFDPERGAFSTIAHDRITGAIKRALENQNLRKASRIPIYKYVEFRSLAYIEKELTQRLGRHPTKEEIAAELEVEPEKVASLQSDFQSSASLDAPLRSLAYKDRHTESLRDLIPDIRQLPEEQTEAAARMARLRALMAKHLSREQRVVLLLRYGIRGTPGPVPAEPLTLEAIASRLNITHQAVRQRERSALRLLEKLMEQEGLGE